jgi:hypothetical protein
VEITIADIRKDSHELAEMESNGDSGASPRNIVSAEALLDEKCAD